MRAILPGKSDNRKLGFAAWDGQLARIDVEKSAYHHVSQNEIAGDNPCSRHLSGKIGQSLVRTEDRPQVTVRVRTTDFVMSSVIWKYLECVALRVEIGKPVLAV
jgi:hypothetical protein